MPIFLYTYLLSKKYHQDVLFMVAETYNSQNTS